MKYSIKIQLIVLFSTISLLSFAQNPEPVVSVVRQLHEFDWYENQAKAWKQEIDNGSTNAMAWVYWSEANRMARNFTDAAKWEARQSSYFLPADQLLAAAEKAIPNTFEYYFLKMQAERSKKQPWFDFLDKAQALRPYDDLLLPWLMNRALIENDKPAMAEVGQNWFAHNEIPQELLTTAYNMLVSLDTNAILLTNGDNDSYPCWVLQQARQIRPDVQVINLSLAANYPSYRAAVFAQAGVRGTTDSLRTVPLIFQKLIREAAGRSVYLSVYSSESIYKGIEKSMYMVGLVLKYSPKPFDNLAVLRNNIENKYLLDFLRQTFTVNPSESVVKMFRSSYLSIFKLLYEDYRKKGETTKAKRLKDLALKIAKDANCLDWVQQYWK